MFCCGGTQGGSHDLICLRNFVRVSKHRTSSYTSSSPKEDGRATISNYSVFKSSPTDLAVDDTRVPETADTAVSTCFRVVGESGQRDFKFVWRTHAAEGGG